MNILREELIRRGNNYELVIHLFNREEEFSKELSTEDNQEAVKSDILSYVKRKYPNIKISAVRLMVGGVLLTTLTLGQAGAAFAAPKDIDTSSEYARAAIERLVSQQVIVGDEKGNFNPKASMDRDAFTTMLVKAMGLDTVTPDVPTFKDVPKDNWAYPFIETAVANNLISGVSADSFAPKTRITREQMAVILVRSLRLSSDDIKGMGDQLTFADKGDISDYARDAVGFAVANGLFRGDESNRFLGKNTATREQVAVVIDKFLTNKDALQQAADAIKNTTFTASVTPDNLTTIRLDFNKAITALVPGDVKIANANGGTIAVTNITLSTDGRSAVLTTDKMTAGVPYTVSIDRETLKGQSTVTPTVVVRDLAVESITAIDAKNILIQFNNKVEAGTGVNGAENMTNYTITPDNSIVGTKLGDDKSSVILTLNTAMTNDTAYTVKVSKNIMDVDGKPLSTTTDYTSYLFFSDHTLPTIRNISTTEVGAIKVAFSENMSAKPDTVILNGQTINPDNISFVPGSDSVTIAKAGLPTNIEVGKSYPIYISGAKDLVGNTMNLFQDTLRYSITTEAPEVDDINAVGENTLEIIFTEAISGANTTGGDNSAVLGLSITKNNVALPNFTTTTTDGKIFRVQLPTEANVLFDGTKNETSVSLQVTVENYKDLANNIGEKYSDRVTVKKDTQAPTLTKADYNFTDGEFVFTFNESLAALGNTGTLASGITLINNNTGVKTEITDVNIKPIGAGDTRLVIRNSGAEGLGLAPGAYTFSFAKGLLKDQALNGGNATTAFGATISVPTSAADAIKPVVASIASTTKDQITVTFSEAVKGGAVSGSATDPDNFRLNGAALPSDTVITLNTGQNIATIAMPAGSIDKTETRMLTIVDVEDLAGNKIVTIDRPVNLTDSTKPILQSAAYDAAAGAIVLSFSETIHGSNATTPAAGDFIVKVNGTTITDITLTPDTKHHQVRLTSQSANFNTGNIIITTAATAAGADAAGNTLAPGVAVTMTR
ncbi:MAG: Endoglucanase [Anaerosolibacter sp.]|jgi:hypothetical protein|uniref:S-layer homology domain-containing protein n=1 Tax=Anaerosolibacter sp. TaxID=1872527 RepID=UPI0026025D30|nr:S-layer homology domain-containing protein [Anaerosolibacter sp.]MDF2548245.1 Endoglucanase [Anaerosolibacter sp.]